MWDSGSRCVIKRSKGAVVRRKKDSAVLNCMEGYAHMPRMSKSLKQTMCGRISTPPGSVKCPDLHDDAAPAHQVERFLEGYGHAGCFNDDIGSHACGHVLQG